MKLHQSILVSAIVIVVASSCGAVTNSTVPSISTPDIGFDVQNETYLKIFAPDGWNSFKTDDSITLDIQNISNMQITADPDFGARIFVLTDDEWIEVKNKTVYKNKPFTIDPLKLGALIVRPELPDYSITTKVRVFVVGTLIENGKESKEVASYIDLTLNP
jgi:hypothetical protein